MSSHVTYLVNIQRTYIFGSWIFFAFSSSFQQFLQSERERDLVQRIILKLVTTNNFQWTDVIWKIENCMDTRHILKEVK